MLDWESRVSVAAFSLRCLEEGGATPEDVLNGEAGRRWIEDSCGGDRELAAEAFELVHPEGRVLRFPGEGF